MADFAEVADVAAWWRELSAAEQAKASTLLTSVSALIRQTVTTVDDRIDDGTLDAEIPKMVAVQAVLRVMRNPDGVASWAIDDVRVTNARRDDSEDPAELFLTDREIAMLRGDRHKRVGTAHVVPTIRP